MWGLWNPEICPDQSSYCAFGRSDMVLLMTEDLEHTPPKRFQHSSSRTRTCPWIPRAEPTWGPDTLMWRHSPAPLSEHTGICVSQVLIQICHHTMWQNEVIVVVGNSGTTCLNLVTEQPGAVQMGDPSIVLPRTSEGTHSHRLWSQKSVTRPCFSYLISHKEEWGSWILSQICPQSLYWDALFFFFTPLGFCFLTYRRPI